MVFEERDPDEIIRRPRNNRLPQINSDGEDNSDDDDDIDDSDSENEDEDYEDSEEQQRHEQRMAQLRAENDE